MLATITVNSAADDATPDDGLTTLREAIIAANANGGIDTIEFNIASGLQVILPLTDLPAITSPVRILGNTQPGYSGTPLIALDGIARQSTGHSALRLSLGSAGSEVRGLQITRFDGGGIFLDQSSGSVIAGNFIGTDGSVDLGNTSIGIVARLSPLVTIGGGAVNDRNVVSGNAPTQTVPGTIPTQIGLYSSNQATIQGNFVGTTADGQIAIDDSPANTASGIILGWAPGFVPSSGVSVLENVVSGNYDAIVVNGADTKIAANKIGTNSAGDDFIGNKRYGVLVTGQEAQSATIGGTEPGDGNVISGNLVGIEFFNGAGNSKVQGNIIGASADGLSAIPNGGAGAEPGVHIHGSNIVVGGDDDDDGTADGIVHARNIISGNQRHGILIRGTATNTVIVGNYIGTTISGNSPLPNGDAGILIEGGSNNTVGGISAGARNVISGNNVGVKIIGPNTSNNSVLGNYIGTASTGSSPLPNSDMGVFIDGAANNTIGGSVAGARNVISGNSVGVRIKGTNAFSNLVLGNYIGVDAQGTAPLGNTSGILIEDAPANLIGGANSSEANVVSGNSGTGITIIGTDADGNSLYGNLIGLDANGAELLGNRNGVRIDSASDNEVGGTAPGQRNRIAGNQENGVIVVGASADGNSIRGNEIFENGNLAIDLEEDGITFNDPNDVDAGPNGLVNYPVGVSMSYDENTDVTTIRGRIDAENPQTFLIDVYGSDSPIADGNAQGFIVTVTPNESGEFEAVVPHAVAFQYVLATATDANGSTSEFNQVRPVIVIPGIAGSILAEVKHDGLGVSYKERWTGLGHGKTDLHLYGGGTDVAPLDALRTVVVEDIYEQLLSSLATGGYSEFSREVRIWPNYDVGIKPVAPGMFDEQGHPVGEIDELRPPTLFVFPYDWRKDIDLIADDLKDFIDGIRGIYPDTDVDIVSHSMGGLVSRRYILENQGNHHVNKMVSVNSPYLGAPKMIYALEAGDIDLPQAVILHSTLRYLVGSFTAAHQLLPSRDYVSLNVTPQDPLIVEDGWDLNRNCATDAYSDYEAFIALIDGLYQRPDITGQFRFRPGDASRAFHDVAGQDDWSNDTSGVEFHHIVTVQAKNNTIVGVAATERVSLRATLITSTDRYFDRIYGPGDGTVPQVSAERIGNGMDLNAPDAKVYTLFSDNADNDDLYDHNGSLLNINVLNLVKEILGNNVAPDSPYLVNRSTATSGTGSGVQFASAIGPADAYYAKIVGTDAIEVRDSVGNSTNDLGRNVAGVSTLRMGAKAHSAALPASGYHEVLFRAGENAFFIEVTRAAGAQNQHAVRFNDVSLPRGTALKLVFDSGALPELTYDGDGDGVFESLVEPSATVEGELANDVDGPTLDVNVNNVGGVATVSLSALDPAGVASLSYSLDGLTLQPYTTPFSVNLQQTTSIIVIADDGIGNRTTITRGLGSAPVVQPGKIAFNDSELEVDEAGGHAIVVVSRTDGRDGQVAVDYSVSAITATPNADYTAVTGTLVFQDGEFEKTFLVPIADDALPEGFETIRLELTNPQGGATLGRSDISLRILDDDGAGVVQFTTSLVDVQEHIGEVTIAVARTPVNLLAEVTVNYATADVTAVAGQDYVAVSGVLTFAATEFVKFITVPIIDDAVTEPSELLHITLTSVSPNAVLGHQSTASVRILASSQKPVLIDIEHQGQGGSYPSEFVDVNGTVYFVADEGIHGRQLWKTNGTAAGTVRVTNLDTFGTLTSLTNFNGTLYFVASDFQTGSELWRSDGTAAGTVLVKDILPGSAGSNPGHLTVVDETLYFMVDHGSSNEIQLWKSDGTATGTVLVKGIGGGYAISTIRELTNVNDTLFFVYDARELWKSDGTEAGTERVSGFNLGVSDLTNLNGTLYFLGGVGPGFTPPTPAMIGLWKSDGTANGTDLVWEGAPSRLIVVGSALYFVNNSDDTGPELWKSNGTENGTKIVEDIIPGPVGSDPQHLTAVGETLYFSTDDGTYGRELWKSNGTAFGTKRVKNMAGAVSSIYYFYDAYPPELNENFVNVGGTLYFFTHELDAGGQPESWQLWRSDGTYNGTVKLGPEFESVGKLTNVGGKLFFAANDRSHGFEPWAIVPPLPALPGDYNQDGVVDGADLGVWKEGFGATSGGPLAGDADADGDVDGADFLAWQQNLGRSVTTPVATGPSVGDFSLDGVTDGVDLAFQPAPIKMEAATTASRLLVRDAVFAVMPGILQNLPSNDERFDLLNSPIASRFAEVLARDALWRGRQSDWAWGRVFDDDRWTWLSSRRIRHGNPAFVEESTDEALAEADVLEFVGASHRLSTELDR